MNYRDRIYSSYMSGKMPEQPPTDESYSDWTNAAMHRLQGWLPASKSAKCLDVGCGSGQALHMLSRLGYRDLKGIDISPGQVLTAKKIWPDVEVAHATQFLRNHVGTFDLITCFDVLEHFTKNELFDFLEALYCALRPGGRLILQTPNAGSPWGMMVRYGDLTHELAFDSGSLGYALRLVGFDAFEVRECGPYIHGIRSFIRTILWKGIRVILAIWNLAETGSQAGGVYTRVFIAKVDKDVSEPI